MRTKNREYDVGDALLEDFTRLASQISRTISCSMYISEYLRAILVGKQNRFVEFH